MSSSLVFRISPNLTSNEMMLTVVKGINLPTPPGVCVCVCFWAARYFACDSNAHLVNKDCSVISRIACELSANCAAYRAALVCVCVCVCACAPVCHNAGNRWFQITLICL